MYVVVCTILFRFQLSGLHVAHARPDTLDMLSGSPAISLRDASRLYLPEGDSVAPGNQRAPAAGSEPATPQGFLLELFRDLRAGTSLEQAVGTPSDHTRQSHGGNINTVRTLPVQVSVLSSDWRGSVLRLVLTCNLSSLAGEVVRRLELRVPGISEELSVARVRVGGTRVPIQSRNDHNNRDSRIVDLTRVIHVLNERFHKSLTVIKLVLKLQSAEARHPPWLLVHRKKKTRFSRQGYRRTSLVDSGCDFSGIFIAAYSSSAKALASVTSSSNSSIRSVHRSRHARSRRHSKRHTTMLMRSRPCHRQDFIVDFRQLGWNKWVVFPEKFNAYYCGGRCPSLIGDSYDPTNHAQLRSLVRRHGERAVPRPCCVPTQLRPLSMLYYENDQLVLRHHEDMIVEKCGCR